MKKRLLSLSLIIALWSILIYPCTTFASETPKLEIQANVEDNIIIADIIITNNPGIATFTLHLHFDNTQIEPISIEKGSALSTGNITSNIQSGEDMSTVSFVSAFWANANNVVSDGTLYTIKFKMKPIVKDEVLLNLTYKHGDICNQELEDVNFEIINKTISIQKESPQMVISNGLKKQDDLIYGNIDITLSDYIECKKADFIVAIYDNHKLISVLIKRNIMLDGKETTVKFDNISITNNFASENIIIRVMCWESINTMFPLVECVNYKL